MATAIMFLTRIPVGNAGSGDQNDLAASTQYFPMVGVIVGAVISCVFWFSQMLWSNELAITLSIIAAVMLTGGFHEDGLADVADSAGAWTKERKLEIMRDSRIGTYGSLALILALVLTILSLINVANTPVSHHSSVTLVALSLMLAHVLSRWSSLVLIYTTPYARDDAANKVFVDGVTKKRLSVGTITALLVFSACFYALPTSSLIALITACSVIALSRLWFLKNIGGITGDCLGAANKLVEVSIYLSFAATLTL